MAGWWLEVTLKEAICYRVCVCIYINCYFTYFKGHQWISVFVLSLVHPSSKRFMGCILHNVTFMITCLKVMIHLIWGFLNWFLMFTCGQLLYVSSLRSQGCQTLKSGWRVKAQNLQISQTSCLLHNKQCYTCIQRTFHPIRDAPYGLFSAIW